MAIKTAPTPARRAKGAANKMTDTKAINESKLTDLLQRSQQDPSRSEALVREINCLIWMPQGWKAAGGPLPSRFQNTQRIS